APTGGVHYTTFASTTSTQLSNGSTNHRVLNAFGGQLYISNNSSAAANRGLFTVGTGIPNSGGPALPLTQLSGFGGAATPTPSNEVADDFWYKDANTLYIADERNANDATNNSYLNGGVQKWAFEDTNFDTIPDAWVFKYNVNLGNQLGTVNTGKVG